MRGNSRNYMEFEWCLCRIKTYFLQYCTIISGFILINQILSPLLQPKTNRYLVSNLIYNLLLFKALIKSSLFLFLLIIEVIRKSFALSTLALPKGLR